ncbi:MAG: hypothetical protein Q4A12_05750, partial [Eubacteriales bacterium]|nr:hypothetical protein [Eubacteriales bacterium]
MKTINVNVDINAHIIDIKCEIDVGVNPSKALVSFYNLGFGTITAVKFNAKGYNSFGDIVKIGGK